MTRSLDIRIGGPPVRFAAGRRWFVTGAFLLLIAPCVAGAEAGSVYDAWSRLPVYDGGRWKPLESLARETLRQLTHRDKYFDVSTGVRMAPTEWYVRMMLDWQGWGQAEHLPDPRQPFAMERYWAHHRPDHWDRTTLLSIDDEPLQRLLGVTPGRPLVTPAYLASARVRPPGDRAELTFVAWANRLAAVPPQSRSPLERHAVRLAGRLRSYCDHRMARRVRVLGDPSDPDGWLSIANIVDSTWSVNSETRGDLRKLQRDLAALRAAYLSGDSPRLDKRTEDLIRRTKAVGRRTGAYPSSFRIDVERAYHRWTPFRLAWLLSAMSLLLLGLYRFGGSTRCYRLAVVGLSGAWLLMTAGFALRTFLSERPPVTNMYESVLFVGFGVLGMGLVFEFLDRSRWPLAVAAVASTLALIVADNCPSALDPSIQPLPPVLQSTFWLTLHVLTVTLGYAAFTLATGLGNVTLGYTLARSTNRSLMDGLARWTYRSTQVGVILLMSGTVLGGIWADYSWGRFWGWDPKEVWALITILSYLAVIHAAHAQWIGPFGLAAAVVMCFSFVLLAWYGVNFLLGTGLHSYGSGTGGRAWMFAWVSVQTTYVLFAVIRGHDPGAVGNEERESAGTSR